MIAGDFLSDREAVEKVVKGAPEQIKALIDWGVNFDKNENGDFDLHREGGHSEFAPTPPVAIRVTLARNVSTLPVLGSST